MLDDQQIALTMEKGTRFLRRYINLLSYDKPHNSLPLLLTSALFLTVNANLLIAVYVEYGNLEKFLNGIVDFVMNMIMFSCLLKRTFNKQETLRLIDVIESEILLSRHEFKGEESKKWMMIEKVYRAKIEHAVLMAKVLHIVFFVLGVLVTTKHSLKYVLGMSPNSKSSSTKWPTPLLSYSPVGYDSISFFVYIYALHTLLLLFCAFEGILMLTSVYLSTERVLVDFDVFYILLRNLIDDFDHSMTTDIDRSGKLWKDMGRIVHFHQSLYRNFSTCVKNSAYAITITSLATMIYECTIAYFLLTSTELKKTIHYAMFFAAMHLAIFCVFHNGQRIFNQNDILREMLSKLPWTDKPHWFKQTLHIMMTRANVDLEMRPYGIYTLNYMSFKDLMRTNFAIGNIFYTKQNASRSQ